MKKTTGGIAALSTAALLVITACGDDASETAEAIEAPSQAQEAEHVDEAAETEEAGPEILDTYEVDIVDLLDNAEAESVQAREITVVFDDANWPDYYGDYAVVDAFTLSFSEAESDGELLSIQYHFTEHAAQLVEEHGTEWLGFHQEAYEAEDHTVDVGSRDQAITRWGLQFSYAWVEEATDGLGRTSQHIETNYDLFAIPHVDWSGEEYALTVSAMTTESWEQ